MTKKLRISVLLASSIVIVVWYTLIKKTDKNELIDSIPVSWNTWQLYDQTWSITVFELQNIENTLSFSDSNQYRIVDSIPYVFVNLTPEWFIPWTIKTLRMTSWDTKSNDESLMLFKKWSHEVLVTDTDTFIFEFEEIQQDKEASYRQFKPVSTIYRAPNWQYNKESWQVLKGKLPFEMPWYSYKLFNSKQYIYAVEVADATQYRVFMTSLDTDPEMEDRKEVGTLPASKTGKGDYIKDQTTSLLLIIENTENASLYSFNDEWNFVLKETVALDPTAIPAQLRYNKSTFSLHNGQLLQFITDENSVNINTYWCTIMNDDWTIEPICTMQPITVKTAPLSEKVLQTLSTENKFHIVDNKIFTVLPSIQ